MPNRRATALALLLAVPFAGCAAGPHQLRRTIDDWDHNLYVNSPWVAAALWVVPVIPVATAGAWVIDFLVTDPWVFWFDDAWDNAGTGYVHLFVQPTDGQVQSLLIDRSGWTRVQK